MNEPNILMLMGWITGGYPPDAGMPSPDAFCVLDNLLSAHVLASDAIVAAQPDAQVACNTSSSSIYESDRLVTDLLMLARAGIPPSDVDRYVDERRALHDAAFTPQHAGEFALRRLYAALSPYGTNRGGRRPALGAAARPRTPTPAASCRRRRLLLAPGPHRRRRRFQLVRPGRKSRGADARPASRRRWASLGDRADIWDVPADPAGLRAWCRTESALWPGLPLWVLENGMATRVEGGRAVPRQDGWDRPRYIREHFAALADAVAEGSPVTAYLHWSLVDNYEWGSYEPRFRDLRHGQERPVRRRTLARYRRRRCRRGGAFAHAVRALASGDRAALGGPA